MTDINNTPESEESNKVFEEQPNEVIEFTEEEMQVLREERRLRNKEKKIEHNKKYYIENRNTILNFEKECTCCNRVYKRHAWSHHVKTNKHKKNLEKLQAA